MASLLALRAADLHQDQLILRVAILCVLVSFLLKWASRATGSTQIPLINPPRSWLARVTGKEAKVTNFVSHGQQLIDQGLDRYNGNPFKIATDLGDIILLAPEYAHEIRGDPALNFLEANSETFHGHIPGFDAFHPEHGLGEFLASVVRRRLTQSLARVTKPVAQEAYHAAEQRFGFSSDWTTHNVLEGSMDVVSRMSSRIFSGDELRTNEEWPAVMKAYTGSLMVASDKLRAYPKWLRPFAATYLVPECRPLREQCARARAIMGAVVEKRRARNADSDQHSTGGDDTDTVQDAIDWFEQESRGRPYDAAMAQIGLSFAAIHTTSDLLSETLLRLAYRPELVRELRAEITLALQGGWTNSSLFNMKLLDSVIKEAQRMRPMNIATMWRKVRAPVTLSTGTVLPRGSRLAVSNHARLSPEEYRDPLVFDGKRYLLLAATATSTSTTAAATSTTGTTTTGSSSRKKMAGGRHQLVSTSPASMGFGHGRHACPGRFFAAMELKVALAHLLLMYDWEPAEGVGEEEALRPQAAGLLLNVNHRAEVRVRRRRRREAMEVDLVGLIR